jgi:hypothetical protein
MSVNCTSGDLIDLTPVNCTSGDLSALVERVEDALVQADVNC